MDGLAYGPPLEAKDEAWTLENLRADLVVRRSAEILSSPQAESYYQAPFATVVFHVFYWPLVMQGQVQVMRSIIGVTQNALRHLQGITAPGLPHVRIGVKGGGCNGLQYVVTPTNTIGPLDEVVDHAGLRLVVCGHSLVHLIGVLVDWKEDAMGARLEFHNPNATSRCGCGKTFAP